MRRVSFTISTEAFEVLAQLAEDYFSTPNRVAAAIINGSLEHIAALGRLPIQSNRAETGDMDEFGNLNTPIHYHNETTAPHLDTVNTQPWKDEIIVDGLRMDDDGGKVWE